MHFCLVLISYYDGRKLSSLRGTLEAQAHIHTLWCYHADIVLPLRIQITGRWYAISNMVVRPDQLAADKLRKSTRSWYLVFISRKVENVKAYRIISW